ncbi:alpha-amylase family glycosyl hydrolase, partial [Vibrio sp. 10N.286.51.F4]
HDTSRILHRCDGNKEKVKLAYLFQFTHSGTPCIYYGSEIGLDGGADPLNRKCMIWDESKHDMDMKQHIMQIIKLRKQHPALRAHNINWLMSDDEKQCLIYQKVLKGESVTVIMNNSNDTVHITLPDLLSNHSVLDIYNETACKLEETLTLAPFS